MKHVPQERCPFVLVVESGDNHWHNHNVVGLAKMLLNSPSAMLINSGMQWHCMSDEDAPDFVFIPEDKKSLVPAIRKSVSRKTKIVVVVKEDRTKSDEIFAFDGKVYRTKLFNVCELADFFSAHGISTISNCFRMEETAA